MFLSPARIEQMRVRLDRARRHMETARSRAGLVATAAGTAAATAGLFTPAAFGESLLATVVTTGAGWLFLPTRRSEGHQKATAVVMYLSPGVSLTGVLIAEQMVTGLHWGEALAVGVWSAGTFWLRPALAARHMLVPPLPPLPKADALVVQEQPAYDHPAAQWWAEQVAVEKGVAPHTLLEDIERTGANAMRAIIRSTVPGQPVPDISVRHLSALMDVPQDLITIGPVPGRGAGVQKLAVGQADEEVLDARTFWAERIAPLAMPGAAITEINIGRMTVATPMEKEIDA